MRITRRFTNKGQSPYSTVEFRNATSEIRNPDGSVVFQMKDIEVPANWSQVACDILAQKYFRKAGVPSKLCPIDEKGVPEWLRASTNAAHKKNNESLSNKSISGPETSAKQVFNRLAGAWTYWGWKGGYFNSEEDAHSFYDELCYMLAKQMVAPNSPQWFNTGL